jgi:chromosome segregation ATPase
VLHRREGSRRETSNGCVAGLQQQKGLQQRTPQISGHGARTPRTPERLKHSLEAALQQRDSLAQDVARLQKEADSALETNRRLSKELQAAQTTQGKIRDDDSKENAPPGPKEQRTVENGRLSLEVKVCLCLRRGLGAVCFNMTG